MFVSHVSRFSMRSLHLFSSLPTARDPSHNIQRDQYPLYDYVLAQVDSSPVGSSAKLLLRDVNNKFGGLGTRGQMDRKTFDRMLSRMQDLELIKVVPLAYVSSELLEFPISTVLFSCSPLTS